MIDYIGRAATKHYPTNQIMLSLVDREHLPNLKDHATLNADDSPVFDYAAGKSIYNAIVAAPTGKLIPAPPLKISEVAAAIYDGVYVDWMIDFVVGEMTPVSQAVWRANYDLIQANLRNATFAMKYMDGKSERDDLSGLSWFGIVRAIKILADRLNDPKPAVNVPMDFIFPMTAKYKSL